MTISISKATISIIVIPDGFVLDGLGHNISGSSGLKLVDDVRNVYVNGLVLRR